MAGQSRTSDGPLSPKVSDVDQVVQTRYRVWVETCVFGRVPGYLMGSRLCDLVDFRYGPQYGSRT